MSTQSCRFTVTMLYQCSHSPVGSRSQCYINVHTVLQAHGHNVISMFTQSCRLTVTMLYQCSHSPVGSRSQCYINVPHSPVGSRSQCYINVHTVLQAHGHNVISMFTQSCRLTVTMLYQCSHSPAGSRSQCYINVHTVL